MRRVVLFLGVMLVCAACSHTQQTDFAPAISMPRDAHSAPIFFSGMKIRIPRGQDVGRLSHEDLGCLYHLPVSSTDLRQEIAGEMTKDDLRMAFENALEPLGYDVVSTPSTYLFEEEAEDEMLRMEFKIGAKLIAMDMVGCAQDAHFNLFGFSRAGVKGEVFATFEWSVFDNLTKKSVLKIQTSGYAKRKDVNREGVALMFFDAFDMAAHNLGAERSFYDLMVRGIIPPHPKKGQEAKDFNERPRLFDPREVVEISAQPRSTSPLLSHMSAAQGSVVLIQNGLGHGSGFFISPQGHILSNAHVVGNARRVRVVSAGKAEKMVAEVLRVDKMRDIALLKLEGIPDHLSISPLPLRTDWPQVGEDIYVMGTPQITRLQDSVTKGIVSAHRPHFRLFGVNVDLIQGDVAVHPGNSGGPLLDQYGNIVGVCVAGLDPSGDGTNAALNYFIPVGSALRALDIAF